MALIDLDIDGIRLPESNVLRWIKTTSPSGYYQNKDDYLLPNWLFPNFDYSFKFYQKINIGQDILTQMAIAYSSSVSVTFELYDLDGNLEDDLSSDLTVTVAAIDTDDYNTVIRYNHTIDTSLLGGVYYCLLTISIDGGSDITYQSELFKVSALTYKEGVLVKYYNNTNSIKDDGVYYGNGEYFLLWLDGKIDISEHGIEREIAESHDGYVNDLDAYPVKYTMLNYGKVHEHIVDKLFQAMTKDNIVINGKTYKCIEIKNTNKKNDETGTLIHSGEIKLQLQGRYNYVPIIEAEAEPVLAIKYDSDDTHTIEYGSGDDKPILYD